MSKVFNMVCGGSKKISSIIITGLSSTDTITCTKDGKSYTATWAETNQHWEIVGLPLGTFTVTATNGTKAITKTVLIDISGVYEIEIYFKRWLYKDGDGCEDVTGGWISDGYAYPDSRVSYVDPKYEDSSFTCSSTTNNVYSLCGTRLKINTIGYDRIVANGVFTPIGTYAGCSLTLSDTKDGEKACQVGSIKGSTENLITLDVSSYQGEYYLCVEASNATSTATVSKVWLE